MGPVGPVRQEPCSALTRTCKAASRFPHCPFLTETEYEESSQIMKLWISDLMVDKCAT